jgi:hypothetical protein
VGGFEDVVWMMKVSLRRVRWRDQFLLLGKTHEIWLRWWSKDLGLIEETSFEGKIFYSRKL